MTRDDLKSIIETAIAEAPQCRLARDTLDLFRLWHACATKDFVREAAQSFVEDEAEIVAAALAAQGRLTGRRWLHGEDAHRPGDPDCPCEVCYPPSLFTDADRKLALGLVGERCQGIAWPALGATDIPVAAQVADAVRAELAEHGCLALRLFRSVDSVESGLLISPESGAEVLVRASGGGWIRSVVERDDLGWFVRIGDRRLDVTINPGRGCCVVSEGA